MSSDNPTKPTNIDELLKQMLVENPELMKDLQKSVPANSSGPQGSSVSKIREKKAPEKDFFLQVISGCETCHAITIRNSSMKWDSEKGCFRQRTFCIKEQDQIEDIRTQVITSRNCPSCPNELNKLEKFELADLILKSSEPEFTIVRLLNLKKKLKEFMK